MEKYVNGRYIEMSEEEIAALQRQDRVFEEKMLKERQQALEELLAERGER